MEEEKRKWNSRTARTPFPSLPILLFRKYCSLQLSISAGKNIQCLKARTKMEFVHMRGKSVSHFLSAKLSTTPRVAWGREAAAVAPPPRSPSLALPILSTWVFRVLNSFRDYRMYPHRSSRSGLPDGCQCLDWRELERWISLSPPPQSSSGLSTPGFDLLPLMEPEFPIASAVPPPSPPSPNLPLSRPDGQTGASSNIDGNDAPILPCLPLPRAPHRIVNDATRLDGDGRIFGCFDSHGEIQLAVM